MDSQTFLDTFEIIAEAPGGIDRIREIVLELAISGRLVQHDPTDSNVKSAIERVYSAKDSTLRTKSGNGQTILREPSASEFPYEVPKSWELIRIDDSGTYTNGVAFKSGEHASSGLPIVRIQNLTNPSADFNYTTQVLKPTNIVKQGELLVSWSATLDAFIWRGPEAAVNQHIFKVDPNSELFETGFLYLCLRWAIRRLSESEALHGLAMKHVNRGAFVSAVIPVPPLHEQEAIVEQVNDLMIMCDELEVAKNKRDTVRTAARKSAIDAISTATTPDELTQSWRRISGNWMSLTESQEGIASLRSLIIELAVQGRLHEGSSLRELSSDGLPSHWTRGQLENFADYIQRGKGPKYVDRSPVPVVSQKCVKWSGFDLSEARFVDPLSLSSYKEDRFLRMGDLLWNSTGTGTVGRTALFVPSDKFSKVVADSHVTIVRTTSLVPRFLWCWSASPVVQAQVLGATTGSTNQQELNLSTIKALPIAFPTEDEQREIVERVDQLMLLCDELEKSLETRLTIQQNLATSVSQFV